MAKFCYFDMFYFWGKRETKKSQFYFLKKLSLWLSKLYFLSFRLPQKIPKNTITKNKILHIILVDKSTQKMLLFTSIFLGDNYVRQKDFLS